VILQRIPRGLIPLALLGLALGVVGCGGPGLVGSTGMGDEKWILKTQAQTLELAKAESTTSTWRDGKATVKLEHTDMGAWTLTFTGGHEGCNFTAALADPMEGQTISYSRDGDTLKITTLNNQQPADLAFTVFADCASPKPTVAA